MASLRKNHGLNNVCGVCVSKFVYKIAQARVSPDLESDIVYIVSAEASARS